MLSLEQAAKFLVVAWVKDWSMRTLLDVVDEKPGEIAPERVQAAATALPFMPENLHWYVANHGSGVTTRHFVADAFPKLSAFLWSAKDNEARLKVASQIAKLRAGAIKTTSRFSDAERNERRAVARESRQATESYRMSRDAFKTHQRGAWSVCKA